MVGECAVINNKSTNHCQLSLITAVLATLCSPGPLGPQGAFGQAQRLQNHPVFAKYPPPQELLAQVESFKREHPDDFSLARADFDLAVRSNREFEAPKIQGQPEPHVIREWPLGTIGGRDFYDAFVLPELANTPYAEANIAFVKQHMDEFTVEFTPALRMVAIDVLLNGWTDWSKWNSERLQEYRRRYPDIYQWDALWIVQYYVTHLDDPSLDGLFLELLLNDSLPANVRKGLRNVDFAAHNVVDMLDFVVACYERAENPEVRQNCWSHIHRISERVSKEQRRAFWLKYLDSPDKMLHSLAVGELGTTRLREPGAPLQGHPDEPIVNRLRDIAANDPDESIRRDARGAVKTFLDDRPPRGLVTPENRELTPKEHQEFWVPFLTSEDRPLRLLAAKGIGQYRQRPPSVPLSQHPEREIVARLGQMAESDPDPEIREAAKKSLGQYTDDSPPRGLIDYNKPQP